MEFSTEFLNNSMFAEQPTSYLPVGAMRMHKARDPQEDESIETGALIQPNGDILFRIYAPHASKVTILVSKRECPLIKTENGVFEGVYPYDPTYCGPHSIDVIEDGDMVIDPYIPVFWHRNRPVNFIEVPDPETEYAMVQDVPHGAVTSEIYFSKELNKYLRCSVYTPAGSRMSGEKYPVLYLQHGATENETVWVYNGRVANIMDNMIAEGKCVPMIVVMNNGMVRYPGGGGRGRGDTAFLDNLIGSCIPYIEANYPVKTDRDSRAIAGLSMGSGQCAGVAYAHPEMFAYIGMFSGRIGIDKERTPELCAFAKDTEKFGGLYKVYFRAIGEKDESSMFQGFAEDDKLAAELGIDQIPGYVRKMYKDQTHEYGAWRRMLYDYAQLLFK